MLIVKGHRRVGLGSTIGEEQVEAGRDHDRGERLGKIFEQSLGQKKSKKQENRKEKAKDKVSDN